METNHRELSTFSCSGVRPHRPAAKLANALKMDFFPDLRPHELTQKLPNMV